MYATRSKYGNEVVVFTRGVYWRGPSHGNVAAPPKRRTPEEPAPPEMQ